MTSIQGVNLSFLYQFIDDCGGRDKFTGLTIDDVCNEFILPMTEQSKLSYIEYYSQSHQDTNLGTIMWYVSYTWTDNFLDIVDSLASFLYQVGQVKTASLYFSLFTCNQHELINSSLFQWTQRVQNLLVESSHLLLVIPDFNKPQVLEDTWCLFELFMAHSVGAAIEIASEQTQEIFLAGSPIALLPCMEAVASRDSKHSLTEDEQILVDLLDSQFGCEALNELVLRIITTCAFNTIVIGLSSVLQAVGQFVVVTPTNVIDYEIPYQLITQQTLLRGKLLAPLVPATTFNNSSTTGVVLGTCPPLSLPKDISSDYHFILAALDPDCTIYERILQVQHHGGAGAVLYNATVENITDTIKPLVGGLSIPAIIIGSKDASKLHQMANSDAVVTMLRWITPHSHSSVNLNLYFAASTGLSSELNGFYTLLTEFGSVVEFTPHFEMYKASDWGCSNITENPECATLCDEVACTFDPEDDFSLGHNGSEVLYYDASQWCFIRNTNQSTYWQFMSKFQSACIGSNIVNCVDNILIDMKLPTIQSCLKYNRTEFYNSEMLHAYSAGIFTYPLVTVNDQPLYGDWHCNEPITMSSCEPLEMVCRYLNYANISVSDGKCTPQYWTNRCVYPREIDECGICTIRDSPNWNNACLGCDGIANSNKSLDMCGVCGGDGSFDLCGECLPQNDTRRNTLCADCRGEPWGGAKVDICGVCGGHGSIDACGLCFEADDPRRQNYGCQIELDPEAMRLKFYIEGVSTEAFAHKDTARGFISTLADVTVTEPENVHIKSIESVGSAVVVNVFLLPNNGSFKHTDIFQNKDLNTLFADTNWNHGSKPLKIKLLAANESQPTTNKSIPLWWYIGGASGLICSMAITTWMIQRRDRRMKKDMHQLFSRYTPLVSLEDEF